MYEFLFNDLQFPVAPEKLQLKISNQNETMKLISGQEINIPKIPGLTEISFEILLPAMKYPFAIYPDGFHGPDFYLHALSELKTAKQPFRFIVNRKIPDGKYSFDTNMEVLLEDYTITEAAKSGFDISVSVKLKQYVSYGTIIVTAIENTTTGKPTLVEESPRPAKQPAKSHTVQASETLWAICRKELGSSNNYAEIAKLNNLADPNAIQPGQVIRLA